MIINLDFEKHTCTVIKENGDPVFHRSNWSDAESTFLYHVKKALINQGFDVIKKRAWKDGHMVDDTLQYVRTRKLSCEGSKDEFYIYNSNYALWDAGEIFNRDGQVILALEINQ